MATHIYKFNIVALYVFQCLSNKTEVRICFKLNFLLLGMNLAFF